MTFWNDELFLVVKRPWAGVMLLCLCAIAAWKLIDLLRFAFGVLSSLRRRYNLKMLGKCA
jgi:hypothetical protein